MSFDSAFLAAFDKVKNAFNSKDIGHNTTEVITDVNTKGLNVKVLATVTLMLIHWAESAKITRVGPPKSTKRKLNINSISTYDLYRINEEDRKAFTPYIAYIIYKSDTKILDQSVVTAKDYPAYVSMFVRYIFEVKQRGIKPLKVV